MAFLRPAVARGACVPGLVGTVAHAQESLDNAHGPFNPIGTMPPLGRRGGSASGTVGAADQGNESPNACQQERSGMPSGRGNATDCMSPCQLNANIGSGKPGSNPGDPGGLGGPCDTGGKPPVSPAGGGGGNGTAADAGCADCPSCTPTACSAAPK